MAKFIAFFGLFLAIATQLPLIANSDKSTSSPVYIIYTSIIDRTDSKPQSCMGVSKMNGCNPFYLLFVDIFFTNCCYHFGLVDNIIQDIYSHEKLAEVTIS